MSTIGELTDIGVPDLIDVFSRRKRSGRLTVKASGFEVALFFEGGRLVYVTSSDLTLRLGRMLIRQGLLDTPRLLEALHAQAESGNRSPLGAILIERGWVTEADLTRCVEEQSIEVVARVIDDQPGFFVFDPGIPSPAVEAIPLNPETLLNAARERIAALQLLRKQLPSPETPLFVAHRGAENGHNGFDDLPIAESAVVGALRTGTKTLDELSYHVALDELTLGVTLLGLLERGVIAAATGEPSRRGRAR